MSMKKIITQERDTLLKNCMEKKLSSNTIAEISTIIGRSRRKDGHESAEAKAKELTELINSCKTEEEILEKLNSV